MDATGDIGTYSPATKISTASKQKTSAWINHGYSRKEIAIATPRDSPPRVSLEQWARRQRLNSKWKLKGRHQCALACRIGPSSRRRITARPCYLCPGAIL